MGTLNAMQLEIAAQFLGMKYAKLETIHYMNFTPGQSNKVFKDSFSISVAKTSKLGMIRYCDKQASILSLCSYKYQI